MQSLIAMHRYIENKIVANRIRSAAGRYDWGSIYPSPETPLFLNRQTLRATARRTLKKQGLKNKTRKK